MLGSFTSLKRLRWSNALAALMTGPRPRIGRVTEGERHCYRRDFASAVIAKARRCCALAARIAAKTIG
jgi:hypothetical protein